MKSIQLCIAVMVVMLSAATPAGAAYFPEGWHSSDTKTLTGVLNNGSAAGGQSAGLPPNPTNVGQSQYRVWQARKAISELPEPKKTQARNWLFNTSKRLGIAKSTGATTVGLGSLAFYAGWKIGSEGYDAFMRHEPVVASGGDFLVKREIKGAFPDALPKPDPNLPLFVAFVAPAGTARVKQGWWCVPFVSSLPFGCPTFQMRSQSLGWTTAIASGSPFFQWGDVASTSHEMIIGMGEVTFLVPADQLTQPQIDALTATQAQTNVATAPQVDTELQRATAPGDETAGRNAVLDAVKPTGGSLVEGWPDSGGSGESGQDSVVPPPTKTPPADADDPDQCDIWVRPKLDTSPLRQPIFEEFPFGVPMWMYRTLKLLEAESEAPHFTINFSIGTLNWSAAQAQAAVTKLRVLLLLAACIGFVFLVASYAFGSGGGGGGKD